jgi:hypothetical protein
VLQIQIGTRFLFWADDTEKWEVRDRDRKYVSGRSVPMLISTQYIEDALKVLTSEK